MKRIVPPALLALAALVVLPVRTTPSASHGLAVVPAALGGDAFGLDASAIRRNGLVAGDEGQSDRAEPGTPSLALAPALPHAHRDEPRDGVEVRGADEGKADPAPIETLPRPDAQLGKGDGTTPQHVASVTQNVLTPTSESTILAWVTPTGFQVVLGKDSEARRIYVGLIEPANLQREEHCLAQAVYFEARSEAEEGRAAVAQVVLNRVKSGVYPTTVCGVVFQNRHRKLACQFTFACEGKPLRITEPEAWKAALRIARDVYEGKIFLTDVGAATHYHTDYVQPTWAKRLKKMDVIGRHIFYS